MRGRDRSHTVVLPGQQVGSRRGRSRPACKKLLLLLRVRWLNAALIQHRPPALDLARWCKGLSCFNCGPLISGSQCAHGLLTRPLCLQGEGVQVVDLKKLDRATQVGAHRRFTLSMHVQPLHYRMPHMRCPNLGHRHLKWLQEQPAVLCSRSASTSVPVTHHCPLNPPFNPALADGASDARRRRGRQQQRAAAAAHGAAPGAVGGKGAFVTAGCCSTAHSCGGCLC